MNKFTVEMKPAWDLPRRLAPGRGSPGCVCQRAAAPGGIAEHSKVIATPHIGAQTAEAQNRAGIAVAKEVISVLQGKEPRWKV
jgi:hypothetical protein